MPPTFRLLLFTLSPLLAGVVARPCGEAPRLYAQDVDELTTRREIERFDDADRLLELLGRGTAPEENGAAQFWQAVWPAELSAEHWAPLCRELGIAVPEASGFEPVDSRTVDKKLEAWIGEPFLLDAGEIDPAFEGKIQNAVADVQVQSWSAPWTRADIPVLADWVDASQRPLDAIVEAAVRPKWYDPPPSLLTEPSSLFMAHSHSVQALRSAVRSLMTRAMLETGSGEYAAAWRDCRACFQLANHFGRQPTDLSQILAISTRQMATSAAAALLSRPEIPPAVIDSIRSDLATLPLENAVAAAIDTSERWTTLEFITTIRQTPRDEGLDFYPLSLLTDPEIDVTDDALLAGVNAWHDRAAAAARLGDVRSRMEAVRELRALTQRFEGTHESTAAKLAELPDSAARGAALAELLYAAGPEALFTIDSADHTACRYEMLKVVAALAAWRAEQGAYPASLEEMTPSLIAAVPIDPYSPAREVFRYEQRGEGFLLYSVYRNGIDDGGTDDTGAIVHGERTSDGEARLTGDHEDLVMRMPPPAFERPKIESLQKLTERRFNEFEPTLVIEMRD